MEEEMRKTTYAQRAGGIQQCAQPLESTNVRAVENDGRVGVEDDGYDRITLDMQYGRREAVEVLVPRGGHGPGSRRTQQ